MSYGFFLKIALSPYGRFLSADSGEKQIVLPEPIGVVRYRSSPPGTPFTEASIILFIGSQYGTYEAAEAAGRKLKDIIQLASLDAGIALDVGRDEVRGGPGSVLVEAAARQGTLLLQDVHGLQVFEETGTPVQLSGEAVARVGSPLAAFENALIIRSHRAKDLDEKHALAAQLHGISRFEASQRSRLLTLVTALDVLSEDKLRGGISQEVVAELLDITRQRLRQARKSGRYDNREIAQLQSLMSIIGNLKYQSISASIKDLAIDVDSAVLSAALDADEIIGLAYKARNDLIHEGRTSVDLSQLLVPLERLTAELCGKDMLSVKECAEILRCSESTIRRNIAKGALRAFKRNGQWGVRPEDLKLFMTARSNN